MLLVNVKYGHGQVDFGFEAVFDDPQSESIDPWDAWLGGVACDEQCNFYRE